MVMGPRVIFRSAVHLMRANLLTRILSAVTLLIVDAYALARGRITRVQFLKNFVMSLLLVASGTLGWELGTRWLVLEFAGGAAEILAGMVGAAGMTVLFNLVANFVQARKKKQQSEEESEEPQVQ
jgi:mannose/fructose/N-acetylgalactosamine-specific phosphotransferase system component IID